MEVNAGNAKVGETLINAGSAVIGDSKIEANTISIPVIKGEKGDPGESSYDDTEIRQLIAETLEESKEYTDTEIANIEIIIITDALPEVGEKNKIYLVPKEEIDTENIYDEYVWLNDKWEYFGVKTVKVDLTEVNQRLDNLEQNKADKSEIPSKTSELDNDSGFITEEDIPEADGILTGSIIEYEGDTIPEGYEEVDSSLIPVTLFESSTTIKTGTFNLSDNIKNYEILDFYWNRIFLGSVNLDGTNVSSGYLSYVGNTNGTNYLIPAFKIAITDNVVEIQQNSTKLITNSAVSDYTTNDTKGITTVIGYKKQKRIKKVSVAPVDKIAGSIVDGTNIDDKSKNTYSANVIDVKKQDKLTAGDNITIDEKSKISANFDGLINSIGLGSENLPVIFNPNLDNMDLNGFAYVTNAYDGTGTAGFYGFVLQLVHGGNYKVQICTGYTDSSKFEYRKCNNGTWGSWHTISST